MRHPAQRPESVQQPAGDATSGGSLTDHKREQLLILGSVRAMTLEPLRWPARAMASDR